jgi:O-6-methylguanine DNA methyltransferase
MTHRDPSRVFAETTERLRRGDTPPDRSGEALLAARLLRTAPAALPDPEFAAALRADLLARRAEAATVRYAPLATPFGLVYVAHRDGVVISAGSAESAAAFERTVALTTGVRPLAEAALPERLQRQLLDHLAGERRFREVDLSGLRPFQRRVLEKTAEIPRGEVRPYGWIAREIGAPGAVRAVGTALGRNPIPFIIPCHRVVRADGSLGEYSGGGPAVKLRVLAYEGAPLPPDESAPAGAFYRGSRTTGIFCYASCRAARRITAEHAVEFVSPARALAAGFRACRLCRPA